MRLLTGIGAAAARADGHQSLEARLRVRLQQTSAAASAVPCYHSTVPAQVVTLGVPADARVSSGSHQPMPHAILPQFVSQARLLHADASLAMTMLGDQVQQQATRVYVAAAQSLLAA